MNLLAEKETRKKLLEMKQEHESVIWVERVNSDFAKDSAMLEDFTVEDESQKENDFDHTQDPDHFATRLRIGTQKIEELVQKN